jgi:biopolymer transport protein ExbD
MNPIASAPSPAGFRLPRRFQPLRGPMDMTALIDVVLLLLFFFMLSSSFIVQPGIRVDPPRSLFGVGARANPLMVTVMLEPARRDPATGLLLERKPFLFFQDQLVTLEELSASLASLPKEQLSQPVVLKADQYVPLGLVTDIMNAAMARGYSVVIATEETAGANFEY